MQLSRNATLQRRTPETHVQHSTAVGSPCGEGGHCTHVSSSTHNKRKTNQTKCKVHQDLIIARSPFFQVPTEMQNNLLPKRRELLAKIAHKRGQASVHLNKTGRLITSPRLDKCVMHTAVTRTTVKTGDAVSGRMITKHWREL